MSTENSRYLSNLRRAEALLAAYQAGDTEAIAHVTERHPRGKEPEFIPTLLDTRLIVSADEVKPKRLQLEVLKKQAKRLFKYWRLGDKVTLERVSAMHPRASTLHPESARLADAQLVIARELGLPSWPQLKAHIEALEISRNALSRSDRAVDTALGTLHIRGGSDIEKALPKAGLRGEFLNILEAYVTGPLRGGADGDFDAFLNARARFLVQTYPDITGNDTQAFQRVLDGLRQDQSKLSDVSKDHRELCLWFEHDTHDQLTLAMVLERLSRQSLEIPVKLVSPDRFPGVGHFLGLGMLQDDPEALRLLWQQRQPVTPDQIAMGARVWRAVCAGIPTKLYAMAQESNPPLTHMPRALRWHLEMLPNAGNGLSSVERRTLEILNCDGPMSAGALFSLHNYEADPLPTLGDLTWYSIAQGLFEADTPAIDYHITTPDAPLLQRGTLSITAFGKAMLAGQANWLKENTIERWVGGVRIRGGQKNWCWDPGEGPVFL